MTRLDELEIEQRGKQLLLRVRVQPRAARTAVAGVLQGALKVRLTAPPLDDRANRQLVQWLASLLELPKSRIELVSGHKSRRKTLSIQGLAESELRARIGRNLVKLK